MPFAKADDPEDFGQPKLEVFALEYLKDLNAAAAARRAGYAPSTSNNASTLLLRHPTVQAAIKREVEARKERLGVEADFVLRELLALASVDLADAYDDKGNLKPLREMPLEVRKAIAGVEVFEEFQGRGEQRTHIGNTRRVKLWDRLKALELLGKHHKLFSEQINVKVEGDLVTRILNGRKRVQPEDPAEGLV